MKELAQLLIDESVKRGAQFMDVRIVQKEGTSISRQDGKADKVSHGRTIGMGIRVLSGDAWGFSSLGGHTLDRTTALEYLDAAIAMAKASKTRVGEVGVVTKVEPIIDKVEPQFEKDPRTIPFTQKMEALATFEKAAIEYGKEKLANTIHSYFDSVDKELVCNTFGTLIESEYVRTRISSVIIAQEGTIRQQGYESKGELAGFELVEKFTPDELSLKAAKMAVSLLSAKRAPAGKFPVVFHPTIVGLLTHEALGHNAEADLVLAGESIIEGKLGQKIASEQVTIIDDATLRNCWGSYKYDSEGTPSQRRIIIENGLLKNYMHSLETAAKMGVPPNGSARAQDHNFRPIVRMSNTFIAPGKLTFEEIIKDIDLGIFFKGGRWGYVFCEKGQFTCNAGEGYMIRNGELAEHIRDVSCSGMTLETLFNIDAVTKDFEMEMPGTCGKNGQGMPVNGGGPYVRVKELVVGGQE